MALEKLRKYSKITSRKELELVNSLVSYYRGERSLGHAAEPVNMPLRAVMEFMQRYGLPYYWDASDTEVDLRRISKIRSTV